jgi:cation transport regulator ChaB
MPELVALPSTLQRSGSKAQLTFTKAHDSAVEEYGSERRAHRVAYAALKHSYEKVGDHWEAKKQRGPSDKRAERGGLRNTAPSAEGVDANSSKKHLLNVARRLDIAGRSTMNKSQLVDAIKKHNVIPVTLAATLPGCSSRWPSWRACLGYSYGELSRGRL